jgi:hypothetical protein
MFSGAGTDLLLILELKSRVRLRIWENDCETGKIKDQPMFGADPDRIGLLGKPPAAEHSFPSYVPHTQMLL